MPAHIDLSGRARMLLRLVQALALAALGGYAAHFGFDAGGAELDGFFQDWIYNGLILLAALSCLVRGIAFASQRAAWLCLGVALLCFFAGELHYTLVLSKLGSPPYPALSDAFFLAFYPASYAALVLLMPARLRRSHGGVWLDGLIGALAISAAAAALLYEPIRDSTGGSALAIATTLAYPLADVVLLGFVVGLLAVSGWRPGRTWAFIVAGLATAALADAAFLYQSAQGTYAEGTLLDALWPTAAVLLGLAAWQPGPRRASADVRGWRVLAIPAAFALTALALLVVHNLRPTNDLALALATATLVAVIARMALSFGVSLRMAERATVQALMDSLTGLSNRRKLMSDLERALEDGEASEPRLLVSFDLDGFKRYNDTFGHPAGDALLARLGRDLQNAVRPHGTAYRLGGDEFCAILKTEGELAQRVSAAAAALSARGEGFEVGSSYGAVLLPAEAADSALALQIADQRLYDQKDGRRDQAVSRQTRDVLLQVVREREPDLRDHVDDVAALARAVGRGLGLSAEEVDEIGRAAELHDIGKMAVPDDILRKRGPLDDAEWTFMHQHTIIGERMLSAAPALAPVAKLVRSSHERWDGGGYPDRLAGEEIPLGARIVAACDALHAMTSDRPYRAAIGTSAALAELRRCAGTQFDPAVVHAIGDALAPETTRSAVESSPARPLALLQLLD